MMACPAADTLQRKDKDSESNKARKVRARLHVLLTDESEGHSHICKIFDGHSAVILGDGER